MAGVRFPSLGGLATRLTAGFVTAAPTLGAALRAHRYEEPRLDWSSVVYTIAAGPVGQRRLAGAGLLKVFAKPGIASRRELRTALAGRDRHADGAFLIHR